MHNTMVLAACLSLVPCAAFAEDVRPQPRAHAHNDYAHDRPLFEALANGFCSVEADVILVDGRLLVAHHASEIRADRSLETLYLAPLRERARKHGGQIYPEPAAFWLLVDIKSDGASTYAALHELFAKYADILTTFRGAARESKAVTIVISGNRPQEQITSARTRYAAIDGRLTDLNSDQPEFLVPWISDNWVRAFRWRGEGEMPQDERARLREIVAKAHARRRLVRFWATPDVPAVWQELVSADVDLINTDDLAGLRKFLERDGGANKAATSSGH